MNTSKSYLRASALGILLSGTPLHAAVIFDNLSSPNNAGLIRTIEWYAQSFVVDADNYTLSTVVLSMSSAFDASGNFFVRIYDATGAGSTPGNVLGTLNGSANPAIGGDFTYTPGETINLNANTTYYVAAGVSSGGGTYRWNYEIGTSIETGSTIGYGFSNTSGSSWTGPFNDVVFNMQVTAVPESVNIALGIFGVLIIGVRSFHRWNNRKPN